MKSPDQNSSFIQAGLEELEAYLPSNILFWRLSGPMSLPRLTIGGLLLAMIRLQMKCNMFEDSTGLNEYSIRLDAIRSEWGAAWENKCLEEAHARMNLWKNYLQDYFHSPEAEAGEYPKQVEWRVLVQLLAHEATFPAEYVDFLDDLDKMVKSVWNPGDFVWEQYFADAFLEPEYWFLYGKLNS